MEMREALALIESMKSEINSLKSDVVALEKANAFLIEEKSSLTEQVEGLNQKNKDLENERKALQKEHNSLYKEKEKLENENQKLIRELYEANVKLDKAVKECQKYKEQYNIEHVCSFVSKSEDINVIINEAEELIDEMKKEESKPKKKGIKKGTKKNECIKNMPFTDIRYEETPQTNCPNCGAELVVATEKERYVVEITPARIKIVKIVRRSKKCPVCSKKDKTLYYVPSQEVFPGSILTPSFASNILYNKYELGIPFHHLAKHYTESLKMDISKMSLSDYAKRCALLMEPIYEKMKDDLLNSPSQVIHSDETPLVVSKDKDKEEDRKKSYVYVYGSSFYDANQINIYSFHESRAIDRTAKWLEGYKGVVICDDYSGYTSLKKKHNIRLQRCFVHVRRKFAEILKAMPQSKRKDTTSYKILELINKLFAEEADYKRKGYGIDKIVEMRRKNHIKIKDKLYEYAFEKQYETNSALYRAVEYMKNVWDDLWTYLDNGYVEISNNLAERAVKPFAVLRKNFQTAGSFAGARYTTIIFSIIRTAMINNLNVEDYLNYILNELSKMGGDQELLKKLLPYSTESIKRFRMHVPKIQIQ